MILPVGPVKSEPAHILFNGFDVFNGFLARVGIVKAQVAQAVEFVGQTKIQADRLGMPDVQVPVGLRRKPGVDPPVIFAVADIFGNDLLDEVGGGSRFGRSRPAGFFRSRCVVIFHGCFPRCRSNPVQHASFFRIIAYCRRGHKRKI